MSACSFVQPEHNDTVAKLDFVLALAECVVNIARSYGSPLADLPVVIVSKSTMSVEQQRRVNQLILYIHALQLLAASMELARYEIRAGRLHPSVAVKNSECRVLFLVTKY